MKNKYPYKYRIKPLIDTVGWYLVERKRNAWYSFLCPWEYGRIFKTQHECEDYIKKLRGFEIEKEIQKRLELVIWKAECGDMREVPPYMMIKDTENVE